MLNLYYLNSHWFVALARTCIGLSICMKESALRTLRLMARVWFRTFSVVVISELLFGLYFIVTLRFVF